MKRIALTIALLASCQTGSSSGSGGHGGAAGNGGMGGSSGAGGSGGSGGTGGAAGTSGTGGTGGSGGAAITCSAPASYNTAESTGMCGTERWSLKTGTDSGASTISLVPQMTTIANLVALPMPSSLPFSSRIAPTERTVFELKNVTANFIKLETDSDYHMVVTDGTHEMIVEVPYPGCISGTSAWSCFITHARHAEDALNPMNPGHQINMTVTVIGVGFFDSIHTTPDGQAPNGIELHPVLAVCFGLDCTPG